MVLNFFGRDSGFGENHTSAFFLTRENDMVIIDCPVSTYHKLKSFDLNKYNQVYVLITHTHGDHVGGLGLFIQHAYFTAKKKITVIAPCSSVASDIETLLKIEGNESSWYKLLLASTNKVRGWLRDAILTEHSPQLKGKCFGYRLNVQGCNVIYTGDTLTLDPFEKFLGYCGELYVDTSVHNGIVHLKLEDSIHKLIELTKSGTKVYLMHLDDAKTAEKIVATIPDIEVVTTI